jgi:ribonuclease P protein component
LARASISSARDFRRVHRTGTKSRIDGITVWAATRPDDGPARLGMSVRATVGNAVERNRLRRRIRAIFQDSDPRPGSDVVVAASKEAAGRNFQELKDVLQQAMSRAGATPR